MALCHMLFEDSYNYVTHNIMSAHKYDVDSLTDYFESFGGPQVGRMLDAPVLH